MYQVLARATAWLTTYAKLGQLRVSTHELYERNLRRYVYPRLGAKRVTEVTREDIRRLVGDLLGTGRSHSLIRNIVAPLRQTFGQLIEDGLQIPNPAASIGRYLKERPTPGSRSAP
jgi:site-specific recombinase XerD